MANEEVRLATAQRTVVIVDPNDGRRERFASAFRRYFEVYSVSTGDLAAMTIRTMRPQVVVVHTEQIDGDGRSLCKQLRSAGSITDALLVLHGQDKSAASGRVLQVQVQPAADLQLSHDLLPQDLLRAVARRLENGPVIQASFTGSVEFYSAHRTDAYPAVQPSRLRMIVQRVRSMDPDRLRSQLEPGKLVDTLTRPLTPVLKDLPADRPLTLREALLAEPSLRNLRLILETPVTPLVPRLPTHRLPTRNEILRAQLTPENLRIVARIAADRLRGRDPAAAYGAPRIGVMHLGPGGPVS